MITNIHSPSLTGLLRAGPTHVHFPCHFLISYRDWKHSAGSPAISSTAGTLAGQWQWECEEAGAQAPGSLFGTAAAWLLNGIDLKEISSCRFNEPPWEAPDVKRITTWHKRERLCVSRADLILNGVLIYLLWFHTSDLATMSYYVNPGDITTPRYILYIQGGWGRGNWYMWFFFFKGMHSLLFKGLPGRRC